MTKGTKIVLIIAVVCIALSLVLSGVAVLFGGVSGTDAKIFGMDVHVGKDGIYAGRTDGFSDVETTSEYMADEDIRAIEVSWTSGKVEFVIGGDAITATETCKGDIDEENQMICYVENGTLKINYHNEEFTIIGIGKAVADKNLTVTVPARLVSEIDRIIISTTSADVTIGGFEPETLRIHSTSGDSFVTDMASGSFVFEATSGCLSLENSAFGKMSAGTTSGNVVMTNVSAGEFSFEATSGELKAEECSFGSVDADGVSGDIYMSLNSVPTEFDAETTSGDVELILPEDAEFELEFDRTSGELELEFAAVKRGDEYIVGNGRNEFSIETTSGDAIIKVK